jgi:ATP-binding cassette subfamily C protein CydC
MKPLLRILGLWRRQSGWLAMGLIVSLASVATGVALLALAGAHVAALVMGGAIAVGAMLQALGPARVLLRYFERLTTHAATFRALADLRVWFFSGLARHSAGGLGTQRSGDVTARIVADVEALDGLYLRIIVPLAAALLLLVVLALLAVEAPWPGLAVAALFLIAAFLIPIVAARGALAGGAQVMEAAGAMRIAVVDLFTGLRDVRAFSAEARVLEGAARRDDAVATAQARIAARAARAQAAGFLCAQAALLLVLLSASTRPVYAVGLLFLTVAAFEAVSGLPRAGALAGNAAAAARRVLETAEAAPAVAEPSEPAPLPPGNALRFNAVHFQWSPDRPELFDSLTLEISTGTRVAILGPSGAGKSTLAALLLKVVAPQAGQVLLGGTDIATLSSDAVRARIGWLGQATHLFDDTIRANLLLGRPDADDAALWRALDAAEIGDFVRALPDQLDTWLGEGGARASGGQGRRIALARTLLTDAPILILDEPCAGLDIATERAFFATLNALPAGRTVVLIAHRLTGVERMDRIWRLSGGHAVAAAA